MQIKHQVIVVGGGAAGMVAAIAAKRLGADVTILERNPRVGKKLLATGNGRCNFTNIHTDIACYHGQNPAFAAPAFTEFSARETIAFFEKLGIAAKVEEHGKVFPMSDQASSVLDVLLYELNELGVHIVCEAWVTDIRQENGKFILQLANGEQYAGDRVILAAGGKAMPASGSDGQGYILAQKLGHAVTGLFPALVQLMLAGDFFPRIDGVKAIGTAAILRRDETVAQDRGDILFTNYGVSGPPVLQISRTAGELLQAGQNPLLKITIIDQMSQEELRRLMAKRFRLAAQKPADFSLVGLIHKRLIPVVLKEAGIYDGKKPVRDLSTKEQEAIVTILTDWRLPVRGTKSWPSAQVTAGGVVTSDIDPQTMASKLTPGLFFAGEILDIDGACGGFNLQWAWSSGFVAGRSAALATAQEDL